MKPKHKLIIGICLGGCLFIYIIFLQYCNIMNISNMKKVRNDIQEKQNILNDLKKESVKLQATKDTKNQDLSNLKLTLDKLNSDLNAATQNLASISR